MDYPVNTYSLEFHQQIEMLQALCKKNSQLPIQEGNM